MRPSVSDDVLCVQKEGRNMAKHGSGKAVCLSASVSTCFPSLQKAKACGGRSLRPDDITNRREFNYFSSVRKSFGFAQGLGNKSSSALRTSLLASVIVRCSVFQDDGPEKANSDMPGDTTDNVPVTQETVQVIPGSKLLWRINSRPPNSAQVCVLHLSTPL